jgi:hypothetical protein
MKSILLLLSCLVALVLTGPASIAVPVSVAGSPSLESAIRAWAAETETPEHKFALVDLNDDGIEDAVVLITNADYCGSGGCTFLVFTGVAEGYKLVSSSTITRAPVFFLKEKHNGWHTLSVFLAGGSVKKGQVLMRFNGKKYPGNPSLQPRAKKSDLEGAQVLITDTN